MSDVKRKLRLARKAERAKCRRSFLRWVVRWAWIEGKQEGEAIPFKLWPAQHRIMSDFLSARLLIILKARQLGLTWLTAAYCLWVCLFNPQKLIVIISAKEDWAIEFLDRVRFIRNRLPDWMVPELDKDGGQHMRFAFSRTKDGKVLDSSEIKSLATTVEGAQGKTPDVMVMDETARNRYARQIYASSKPGIDKAGGRIIVISNSHKDGTGWGWTRGIYQNAMKGLNDFKRIFMPWWDCPDRVTAQEAKKLDSCPSGFDQNGKVICVDFKQKQISGGYDEDDFSQNYPETEQEAVSAMMGSYFGKSIARHEAGCVQGVVGRIIKSQDNEIDFEDDEKGPVEIWRFPYHLVDGWDGYFWTNRYAIGSDVSEGLGQSYSVAYVIDRYLDEKVCRVRSNKIDAHEWGTLLHDLSVFYCSATDHTGQEDKALICAERTGAGQTTVKRLVDLDANQYVREVPGRIGSGMTKEFGWHESQQAKHDLCADLKTWFKTTRGGLYDQTLIDECSTTIRHDGGGIGPEDDTKYWDCVVAAGCTIQASKYIGGSPKRIEPPVDGWLKREIEGSKSAWVA